MSLPLTVSTKHEGTAEPWWAIVDPKQNMRMDVHSSAMQVTGPFFSREEGEEVLARTRYNYSSRAVVYCMSGCYTDQYKKQYRQGKKGWWTRLKEAVCS